jgi:hypothetical protein
MLTLREYKEELTERQVFDTISGGRIIHGAYLITHAGGAMCCFIDNHQFIKIFIDFPNDLQRPFNSKYRVDLIGFPSEVHSNHTHYELYMETLRIDMECDLIPIDVFAPYGYKNS